MEDRIKELEDRIKIMENKLKLLNICPECNNNMMRPCKSNKKLFDMSCPAPYSGLSHEQFKEKIVIERLYCNICHPLHYQFDKDIDKDIDKDLDKPPKNNDYDLDVIPNLNLLFNSN